MKKILILLAIAFAAVIVAVGYKSASKQSAERIRVEEDGTVVVPAEIFCSRDSVMYYAERAFLKDDPKGCFVVGACYYLRQEGELPDYIHVVEQDLADEMLMLSADNGYQPAIDLIRCLQKNNCWNH